MSALTNIGSTDWHPSAIPGFGGGGYELDSCTVPWRGRATSKQAFVDALPRFQSLPAFAGDFPNDGSAFHGYPYMFLNSISDDQEPVFPTVTLSYVGLKNGAAGVPPPKYETSFITLPISVTNLTGPGLGAISFTGNYKAPRTKWTWYSASAPASNPAYTSLQNNVNLLTQLFNLFDSNSGAPVSPALAARYLAPLHQTIVVNDYVTTPVVPNAIWTCSCTVDKNFSQ